MKIDGKDIGILVALWEEGARMIEIPIDTDMNIEEVKKRVHRLSRAGLCGCSRQFDYYGPGHNNDPIWGITPQGIEVIELSETEYAGAWREEGWSIEY